MGTKLASSGLPQGLELEILNSVRDEVPPEVFTTPYINPVYGTPHASRTNLREATRLLEAAGYSIRNMQLIDKKTDEQFTVEFLSPDPSYERFFLFYAENLKRIGVGVTIRAVDDAQYQNRLRQWDYDIIVDSWSQTLTPGNELRGYFGSEAACNARFAQLRRHQEPCGRHADWPRHRRQGSRRTQRGRARARPRLVMEPLRGAAMDLQQNPDRPLGSLRQARPDAGIRTASVSDDLVVGRRARGESFTPMNARG